jgi:hypothetical protein
MILVKVASSILALCLLLRRLLAFCTNFNVLLLPLLEDFGRQKPFIEGLSSLVAGAGDAAALYNLLF